MPRQETADERARRKARNRRIVVSFFAFIGLVAVLESPLARVRHIRVSGNTTVPMAQIVAASGVAYGESLWAVNRRRAAMAVVAKVPMVDRAAIDVSWPSGTVSIQVHERDVVAVYAARNGFYELMSNGYVYQKIASAAGLSYPILTGQEPVLSVHQMASAAVSSVCHQLAQVPASELNHVSEIQVNGDGTVTLYLDNDFEVLADVADLRGAMAAIGPAVDYFVAKGYRPGLIDLTGPPPYRYTPFSSLPGATAKASGASSQGALNGGTSSTAVSHP
ncbi:FtsQ-type POTRA domain-containing protein [Alicyclobacillus mali]|uniref:FtsQ-type POTRA domain-containing protein n=1 Tax=Alicyclobacillus mali (ex Roth et al. 2021) TaxID=1123961 RepID=A0ABS0F2R5_9BACL|nr:FtsQ-type POTRA domain-containing protein [Alicyclobacillus mali (ex Roth et al. 2021)]MBF8377573.1 FtsQ-type POTRA domain-containing protein [Alicyclobacillus mali (ex Roth et al. 2021)]MCL6489103.1 FtsQ-type POTRA domain-containing protein [Alicyclobacillus mali (ex Roth et al. 2021)]